MWIDRQIWPWSTGWSRVKANRGLPREHTGHSEQPLLTTHQKTLHMNISRWPIPNSDWFYSLQPKVEMRDTVSKNKTGDDCSSDHEFIIAKFTLNFKKVGQTTRPFRYDLNQIPKNYTVEVRNRFKGLDPMDRVPDEVWMEVCDIV